MDIKSIALGVICLTMLAWIIFTTAMGVRSGKRLNQWQLPALHWGILYMIGAFVLWAAFQAVQRFWQ
jgi:hypothetical protein